MFRWEVDGTGSGSCPVADFFISGVEPSCSATRELISKIDFRKMGCENGRWIKVAQDLVNWRTVVLAVLNLCVLLPQN
jgi:hypothetical protein